MDGFALLVLSVFLRDVRRLPRYNDQPSSWQRRLLGTRWALFYAKQRGAKKYIRGARYCAPAPRRTRVLDSSVPGCREASGMDRKGCRRPTKALAEIARSSAQPNPRGLAKAGQVSCKIPRDLPSTRRSSLSPFVVRRAGVGERERPGEGNAEHGERQRNLLVSAPAGQRKD